MYSCNQSALILSTDSSDGPSPQKKERLQRRLDRIEKRQQILEAERKKKEQEDLLLEQKEVTLTTFWFVSSMELATEDSGSSMGLRWRGTGGRPGERGREVYGRREKRGREVGEKGENYATLHNILQLKNCKEAGPNKYRSGTGIKGYGKREA